MEEQKLFMAMIFQIEAKSEKAKENMKNKILDKLKNILDLESITLEYDIQSNSFAYIEESIEESFEDKVFFLLSTLQNFGYCYVVTGNLENKKFDICTSKTNMNGICFVQGDLHYLNLEEE
ncbi:hypothetical protein E4O00_12845 [Treponema sp. OMZ 788]|uniref:Rpn family recombination-promoting nuclease/putative transposase n=1 Tax=Treponema sp. OMZ 788 TaxID=2563664 RepID=UPI0020A3D6E2|nr:Rpn family recombination-promoting nuclease/putative transposase [Treponema sp. OMZ 788]UTC64619.1 hypothetical protein E4O00_12845 [Treponema sp. OMZ 788]